MSDMAKHEIPAARRDHLWVLFVIAACVLAEVWASWVGIGSISGFPVILGQVPTDWVLAVAMEAYWGYALYAWLVASPGRRSRAMAMWSCAVVFALSLAGQVLYHELTVPPGMSLGRRIVVGFITSLPVIVLALIAVLTHMRHADREEAAETARRTAEAERQAEAGRIAADERTELRRQLAHERAGHRAAMSEIQERFGRELDAMSARQEEAVSDLRQELVETRDALETAGRERSEALRKAEALHRRIDSGSVPARPRSVPVNASAGAPGSDGDVTTELRALMELQANPELCKPRKSPELAELLGISKSYARKLHGRLTREGAVNPEVAKAILDGAE